MTLPAPVVCTELPATGKLVEVVDAAEEGDALGIHVQSQRNIEVAAAEVGEVLELRS